MLSPNVHTNFFVIIYFNWVLHLSQPYQRQQRLVCSESTSCSLPTPIMQSTHRIIVIVKPNDNEAVDKSKKDTSFARERLAA